MSTTDLSHDDTSRMSTTSDTFPPDPCLDPAPPSPQLPKKTTASWTERFTRKFRSPKTKPPAPRPQPKTLVEEPEQENLPDTVCSCAFKHSDKQILPGDVVTMTDPDDVLAWSRDYMESSIRLKQLPNDLALSLNREITQIETSVAQMINSGCSFMVQELYKKCDAIIDHTVELYRIAHKARMTRAARRLQEAEIPPGKFVLMAAIMKEWMSLNTFNRHSTTALEFGKMLGITKRHGSTLREIVLCLREFLDFPDMQILHHDIEAVYKRVQNMTTGSRKVRLRSETEEMRDAKLQTPKPQGDIIRFRTLIGNILAQELAVFEDIPVATDGLFDTPKTLESMNPFSDTTPYTHTINADIRRKERQTHAYNANDYTIQTAPKRVDADYEQFLAEQTLRLSNPMYAMALDSPGSSDPSTPRVDGNANGSGVRFPPETPLGASGGEKRKRLQRRASILSRQKSATTLDLP